ncbi:MAG: ATP-binding protein [Clostridiales bacterium]|nr:ATP-binding protein [Clostridiales bacterium]
MNEMYEEVQHILENRRIHSEIRLHDRIEKLHHQYPDLESIEQEIARVTEEELLMALDGKHDSAFTDKIDALDKKREELLTVHGLTKADFEVQPYCKRCGDTGFVEIKKVDGEGTESVMCDCVRKLLAPTMVARSKVNDYPDYSFEFGNEEFFGDNEKGKKAFLAVRTMAERRMIHNMVLFGTAGKGKTFTAVSAAREYASAGMSALVLKQTEAQEILMEYRKLVQSFYTEPAKERRIKERREALTEVDLLVLDDLGVEAKNANTEGDLLYILDTRVLHGRPTIITTNYDIPSLKSLYGARVYDRLKRSFQLFSFSAKKED